ncbi:axotactin-like isoform X1 [Clytia hemisphaerica]|uniref:Uncharacterized protein n=1 Tax=Clytia hemisphaerica TaxID=252671 RepID=A0A7M5UK53_9CNID
MENLIHRKTNHLLLTLILVHQFIVIQSITFLDKSKSYAVYNTWNITEAGKLELSFKTQTSHVMLLYVDSVRTKDTSIGGNRHNFHDSKSESFLQVTLINGAIEVTQQIDSEEHTKVIRIGENLNDLKWHRLVLTKFVGTLQVEVDHYHQIVNYPNEVGQKFHINSRLFVGGLSEQKQLTAFGAISFMSRFFGCIKDLRYSSGTMKTKPALELLKGQSVATGCIDKCKEENPCQNAGRCVNLFTRAGCDCFGTGYGGAVCNTKSQSITIEEKDHIKWHVRDFRSSGTNLRMRFKAAKPDGVLFFTKRGGNILAVEIEDGMIRVAAGKATEIPKSHLLEDNIFDAEWHSLQIMMQSDKVLIMLDQNKPVTMTIITEKTRTNTNGPVYFGGIDSPYTFGVTSQSNFVGCLQQIEYNTNDVIYKVLNTISKRIETIGKIRKGCSYSSSNINVPTEKPETTKTKEDEDEYPSNGTKETVIKEIHTREGGMGQNFIIWITAGIVIGTIIILISAACVVHHVRLKYYRMKAQQQVPQHKDSISDDDETPMKEIEPEEKSNASSRAGTPTLNIITRNNGKEDDEYLHMLNNVGGGDAEVSEV